MPGLQHVTLVPHVLVVCQELNFVCAVFLLGWTQLPGEESEGLPDVLQPLLEDGTHGCGGSVRDKGEWRGWLRMSQENGSRQTRFTLVESSDECVGIGNRI
jgi:hypothetical protein